MKHYLIDFFKYNDRAYRTLVAAVGNLPEKAEALRLLSHLVTSHDKWFHRITPGSDDSAHSWFGDVYAIDGIEARWDNSLKKWLTFLETSTDNSIEQNIVFHRPSDGKAFKVKIRDIMLQLNYHSIHHRAQVSAIIRSQGQTPPATDYILAVLKEA